MKSFLTWLHESDTPAESAWDLRDQKKIVDFLKSTHHK